MQKEKVVNGRKNIRPTKILVYIAQANGRKVGTIAANPQRMGPITLESRLMGLERILSIQNQINKTALATKRPTVDLINQEEEARIRELIDLETWPQGWDGDEALATTPMDKIYFDGAIQPMLFGG